LRFKTNEAAGITAGADGIPTNHSTVSTIILNTHYNHDLLNSI
jgi:hypothetical protein